MKSPADILGGMVAIADEQITNLTSSIGQVQEQIDDYIEEVDGVENGQCAVAESELTSYLNETKLGEVGGSTVNYGPNYGKIDYTTGGITDFKIVDSLGVTIYEYLGTGWDGDTTITKLINDYAFGNDYLTRPLTTGASYGLYPNITALTSASSILNSNKNKVTNSKTSFEDYI